MNIKHISPNNNLNNLIKKPNKHKIHKQYTKKITKDK